MTSRWKNMLVPPNVPRIVAFAGKAGAGKDTAAMALRMRGYALVRFADPIKDALASILGVSRMDLEDRGFKEALVPGLGVTQRFMAQTLGTEWGRESIHPDIWVLAAERRVNDLLSDGYDVVIPDCRFRNEAEWVLRRGGVLFHVERPGLDSDDDHPSEAPILDDYVTATLLNDGGPLDLHAKVHAALAAVALKRRGLDG